MRIHHIGYLVKKIEKAAEEMERLGYRRIGETVLDPIRRIHILFMETDGYVVELVSPAEKDSVVSNLIKTYKNAPYHICYETERFDEELTALTAGGYLQIDEPCPAPAICGQRVVFLMHPQIGMIELLDILKNGETD